MRRINTKILLDGVSSAELSDAVLVEDYRHLSLYVALVAATTTIKVKASSADSVDFSSASTISNPWYYVDLKGLGDAATTVTGSTGITATTGTSTKGYAINIDMAKWIAVDAEAVSAGSVSVMIGMATNQ